MTKLNQILAIEKGTKSRVYAEVTQMNASAQKPALFSGFTKAYTPKEDDGEVFPPESQRVQMNARDMLASLSKHLGELFDISAAKDWANCHATADVTVDVHDLRGALVCRLHSGRLEGGERTLVWDGRDTGGRLAASGVYLVRMRAGDALATGRVVVVR